MNTGTNDIKLMTDELSKKNAINVPVIGEDSPRFID